MITSYHIPYVVSHGAVEGKLRVDNLRPFPVHENRAGMEISMEQSLCMMKEP